MVLQVRMAMSDMFHFENATQSDRGEKTSLEKTDFFHLN